MRLLLVEDDQNLSDAIAEQLQKEGYITDCCYDGETALHYALNPEYGYDIVLLDRMLPIIDGLTVLKAMRQKQIFTPVLILTGLGELEDKIEGLDCGADDYLVKPFHIRELLARIRALTRRPVEIQERKTITAYGLVLDAEYRRLTYQGKSVILTQKETNLITVFLEQPDMVQSRSQLLWKVWGGNTEVEDGNVDNYIHFLRKRLRELGCKVSIKTVYGAGYRLEETPCHAPASHSQHLFPEPVLVFQAWFQRYFRTDLANPPSRWFASPIACTGKKCGSRSRPCTVLHRPEK